MITAFTSRRNLIPTLVLLAVCALSAIAAIVIGIDDNPPGILLAFLAAVALILAFAHPWRTARKFMFLLLGSVLGIVLFIILNITSDLIAQNPNTPDMIKTLLGNPAYEAFTVIFVMILPAAFLVGAIGALVKFLRNRRRTT
jgi:uncharacterized membrane protein (UPF0136 family)